MPLGSIYEQTRLNISGSTLVGAIQATNLLETHKTCEERQVNINEIAGVEQKVVTFGQYISGQSLGNEIYV